MMTVGTIIGVAGILTGGLILGIVGGYFLACGFVNIFIVKWN